MSSTRQTDPAPLRPITQGYQPGSQLQRPPAAPELLTILPPPPKGGSAVAKPPAPPAGASRV